VIEQVAEWWWGRRGSPYYRPTSHLREEGHALSLCGRVVVKEWAVVHHLPEAVKPCKSCDKKRKQMEQIGRIMNRLEEARSKQ